MKTGIELIAQERKEQIEKHGRTIASDVIQNQSQELAIGAIALLETDCPDEITEGRSIGKFPIQWDNELCLKMVNKSYKDRLIIAGAFCAAEIDRLNALES